MAAALVLVGTLGLATKADAATIQLGFILDRSGSIGAANWTTIVNGLATAINTYIPVGGTDIYEVSVVAFSTTASIEIDSFLVTDAAARTTLAGMIAAIAFTGGGTNFAPAFDAMLTALTNGSGIQDISYVNFATDGVEGDQAAAIVSRNALIAAGVDNISIEGIGAGVDVAGLTGNYCYPQLCDTVAPFDFPAQGFFLQVANAQGYADAIGGKIQIVTGADVPEPSTVLLIGAGIAAVALRRRRARNR